jgi:low affinity Fe/Cu permease
MRAGIPAGAYGKSHASASTWFGKLAGKTAQLSGKPGTFILATTIVVVWGITGPLFKYSNTWQLVINTGTTIVTFLMVFLIQNTQNRDTAALQVKLDELIVATKGAPNNAAGIEDASDEELSEAKKDVRRRADTEKAPAKHKVLA